MIQFNEASVSSHTTLLTNPEIVEVVKQDKRTGNVNHNQ